MVNENIGFFLRKNLWTLYGLFCVGLRFLLPTCLVAGALIVQILLRPVVCENIYILLFPAICVGALLGRFWPSVFASFVGTLGALYFSTFPYCSFKVAHKKDIFSLVVLLGFGLLFSAVGRQLRISRLKEKLINKELNIASIKFQQLTDFSPDATLLIDRTGRIELFSREAEKAFLYPRSEVIGKCVAMLLSSRSQAEKDFLRRIFFSQSDRRTMDSSTSIFARRKDGSEFPVDISLGSLKTADGVLTIANIRDISWRYKLEEQQRFLIGVGKELAENIDYVANLRVFAQYLVKELADWCLVYTCDPDFRPTLQELAHRDVKQEVRLRNYLIEHSPSEHTNQGVVTVLKTRTSLILTAGTSEWEAARQANPIIRDLISGFGLCSFVVVPMIVHNQLFGALVLSFGESGRRYAKEDLAFLEDVARRSALSLDKDRLYRLALDAIRTREEVVAIVSHDLKNPLTAIRMSSQMIARVDLTQETAKGQLTVLSDRLVRSTHQMNELIISVLDLAKIQAGTFIVELKKEYTSELLQHFVDAIEPVATASQITLHIEVSNSLPAIYCDRIRIDQVLSNVVGNALKFTPSGGHVSVRVSPQENEVLFSVHDNGPGIEQSQLSHVFERYWQAKATAHKGSGLGLSIAKGIIDAHHGRIWAESELGQGTTFFFTVPIFDVARGKMLLGSEMSHLNK
jgi:PAS domain S-box-containing protein